MHMSAHAHIVSCSLLVFGSPQIPYPLECRGLRNGTIDSTLYLCKKTKKYMLSDFAKRETDSLNLAKESKAQVFALKKKSMLL